MTPRHRARLLSRPVALVAGFWLVWLAVVFLLAPRLIEAAWAGRAPDFLSAILSGRSIHPVAWYQGLWSRLALRLTAGFGFVTVLFAIAFRYRSRILPRLRPLVEAVSVPVGIGVTDVLLLAIWTGTVLGLIEAGRATFYRLAEHLPTVGYYREIVWVAPLASVVSLGLLAVLLIVPALVLWPRRAGLRIVPSAVAVVGLYAVIRQFGGIHPVAALGLAAGLTVASLRWTSADPARSARFMRRSGFALVSMLLVYGIGLVSIDRLRESRQVRSLAAAPQGAYNVLLLILDTVRAPELSLYGYDRPTTPNLDHLAGAGTVFESAFSSAPWTLPSHASIFTGLPSFELSADYMVPLDDVDPTLAEVLTRAGFATGGFVANYYYAGQPSGLARGFIHYEAQPIRPDFIASAAWLPRRVRMSWNRLRDDERRLVTRTAADVNRAFIDWLPTVGDHPFFAFLNYIDAHDPYAPPEPWMSRWAETGSRYSYGFHEEYSAESLQELRDHYDASISYIDAQINELLRELDRQGRLDNTLVIITADHGEELGEHAPSLVRHGWSLYSPSLHVPLIMMLPGVVPAGDRIDSPVSTTNLAATILDIVAPRAAYQLPGQSLARFWGESGQAGEPAEDGDVIVSAVNLNPREVPPSSSPILKGPMTSILDGRFHFILNGDGTGELYDIRSDPWELRDLAGSAEYRRTLAHLRKRLLVATGAEAIQPLPQ
jgi:arylsulfatase A-like enzyme